MLVSALITQRASLNEGRQRTQTPNTISLVISRLILSGLMCNNLLGACLFRSSSGTFRSAREAASLGKVDRWAKYVRHEKRPDWANLKYYPSVNTMIPPRDIRFVQQKAFKLLSEGQSLDALKELILTEGGDAEQVQTLSAKYEADYAFLMQETGKSTRKAASSYQLAGGVILLGGVGLTTLSYLSMDGQGAVFFWGILVIGAILVARGVSLKADG